MSFIVNIRQTMVKIPTNLMIRNFTTGATVKQRQGTESETRSPVYELRTYSIHPAKVREYLDLTTKEFHLRTAHSKLVGFWTSEIGGLNQVVHLWEYGSLSERAGVRARLAADPEWLSRYISPIVVMLQRQDNVLLTLFPGGQISPPVNKGVYELQTMQLHGSPTVWSKALLEWVSACERARKEEGSTAVGVWKSVLGPRQTAVVLWQHQGPDGCLSLDDAATTVPESEALAPLVTSAHSKLLLPYNVSPMQ